MQAEGRGGIASLDEELKVRQRSCEGEKEEGEEAERLRQETEKIGDLAGAGERRLHNRDGKLE